MVTCLYGPSRPLSFGGGLLAADGPRIVRLFLEYFDRMMWLNNKIAYLRIRSVVLKLSFDWGATCSSVHNLGRWCIRNKSQPHINRRQPPRLGTKTQRQG